MIWSIGWTVDSAGCSTPDGRDKLINISLQCIAAVSFCICSSWFLGSYSNKCFVIAVSSHSTNVALHTIATVDAVHGSVNAPVPVNDIEKQTDLQLAVDGDNRSTVQSNISFALLYFV